MGASGVGGGAPSGGEAKTDNGDAKIVTTTGGGEEAPVEAERNPEERERGAGNPAERATPPRAPSTSTKTSWPRLRRLSGRNVSLCGICAIVCEPGTTRMAPFSGVLSDRATHAVTISAGSRPQ